MNTIFNHALWVSPLFWTLILLAVAIFLFVRSKIRMDVVALLVMLAFCLSGILTVDDVFAGFSDPNIIMIALLFIVGEGLVRTGVAYQVSDWLMKMAKNSENRVLVLLMVAVATLGAFMSSTGIVAIFIPVVLAICQQMNISPKRLMMPLSVAGLISGMMTLIATAPNLVVNSELLKSGHSLGFFSFTPMGIVILVIGVLYMFVARRWLAPDNTQNDSAQGKLSLTSLIDEYHLNERTKRFVVRKGSSFIGKTVESLELQSHFGINILAIERWKHFRPTFLASSLEKREIREKDILLLDISHPEFDLADFCQRHHLENAPLRAYDFSQRAKSIGLAEITPVPESNTIGKTATELRFHIKYSLNLVGIKRNGEVLSGDLSEMPLNLGDQILVLGDWRQLRELRTHSKEFFVLDYPAEIDRAAPAQSQSWHAIGTMIFMVVLMVSGIVPNVVAVLIACLLLGKFRCVDAKSAYESIHWPSLILIIGMMPFSTALQKTGGVNLIVDFMIHTVGTMGKHWILISLFMLCAVVGLFISNTATAILVAPIAISMAHQLGLSPMPFAMTVAIASSAAFMTPVSSPTNTMVLGPGKYQFSDFVKIGVPFTILVMLVTVFLVPVLFPFH